MDDAAQPAEALPVLLHSVARSLASADLSTAFRFPTVNSALHRVMEPGCKHVIVCTALDTPCVSRYFDILLGFRAKTYGLLQVSIGGRLLWSRTIHAGQFLYAVDDTTVIPLVCVAFEEVRVDFTPALQPRAHRGDSTTHHLDMFYLLLNTEGRLELVDKWCRARREHQAVGKWIEYRSGICTEHDTMQGYDTEDTYWTELPNMRSFV